MPVEPQLIGMHVSVFFFSLGQYQNEWNCLSVCMSLPNVDQLLYILTWGQEMKYAKDIHIHEVTFY